MSPQLVDFDADGQLDMVMGTFEGVAYLVRGTEGGYLPPEYILDGAGNTILLAQFWNRPDERWDAADRSPQGESYPDDHCISVVALDWDADGDLDLLLGAKEGRMYLRRNEGAAGAPKFALTNERIESDGEALSVPGGLTAPRVIDWDGDGLFDLVCGSFQGGVYLYENEGERGAPEFGEPVALVPSSGGTLKRAPGEPGPPTAGTYVDAVDYDGDGDLDLLVGGKSSWENPVRELSVVEQARAQELRTALAELDGRIEAMRDVRPEEDDEDYETWHAPYVKARDVARALRRELSPLEPGPKQGEFVWLYRRSGGAPPATSPPVPGGRR